jgi:hypothetical protein
MLTPPPESLRAVGVTHWSSRRLADWLGRDRGISVSHDSITVLWRKFCLQPHRTEGFRFSTDPQLQAKVRDVAGLAGRGPVTEPDPGDVIVRADHRIADQESGRQLDVISRRVHGHGQRAAVHPDAERLLRREQVRAGPSAARKRVRR